MVIATHHSGMTRFKNGFCRTSDSPFFDRSLQVCSMNSACCFQVCGVKLQAWCLVTVSFIETDLYEMLVASTALHQRKIRRNNRTRKRCLMYS